MVTPTSVGLDCVFSKDFSKWHLYECVLSVLLSMTRPAGLPISPILCLSSSLYLLSYQTTSLPVLCVLPGSFHSLGYSMHEMFLSLSSVGFILTICGFWTWNLSPFFSPLLDCFPVFAGESPSLGWNSHILLQSVFMWSLRVFFLTLHQGCQTHFILNSKLPWTQLSPKLWFCDSGTKYWHVCILLNLFIRYFMFTSNNVLISHYQINFKI